MKLVGLTGGIGCGKTTVLKVFRSLGVPCFVADDWAKGYYEDRDFVRQIGQHFGEEVVNSDGTLNRRSLAALVFSDSEALARLNAMIHPRVMDDFRSWAQRQESPYVILESAIIFENSLEKYLDKVITVYVELDERLRRLKIRDKASEEELRARISNQLPEEVKMDCADYVVLNYEGNPRKRQVEQIDKELRELS